MQDSSEKRVSYTAPLTKKETEKQATGRNRVRSGRIIPEYIDKKIRNCSNPEQLRYFYRMCPLKFIQRRPFIFPPP